MLGVLIPAVVVAVLGLFLAGGVAVFQRVRSGQSLDLSLRTVAAAYFYLMTIASFLLFTVGLSIGVKALLSDGLGRQFSYYLPPARMAPPAGKPPPGPPVPLPEEQAARNAQEADRQYRNDLIQGGTLAVVGGALWGLHAAGRRRVLPEGDPARRFMERAHTIVLLGIFGLAGIVALPMAVYELLRFFLMTGDEMVYGQPPGASVATAAVFVPIWVYYLLAVLRLTRQER